MKKRLELLFVFATQKLQKHPKSLDLHFVKNHEQMEKLK